MKTRKMTVERVISLSYRVLGSGSDHNNAVRGFTSPACDPDSLQYMKLKSEHATN